MQERGSARAASFVCARASSSARERESESELTYLWDKVDEVMLYPSPPNLLLYQCPSHAYAELASASKGESTNELRFEWTEAWRAMGGKGEGSL